MIERERKYRLSEADAGRVRTQLKREARSVREEKQETTVLKDRASHLRKGAYLRVRAVSGAYELTHKGPKQAKGKDKLRIEQTIGIGPGPIFEVLELMGFRAGTHYVKDTAVYEYRGALVSVDLVEGIGWFCEIEANDLETDTDAVASALGLRDEDFEPRGYPAIVAQALKERSAAG